MDVRFLLSDIQLVKRLAQKDLNGYVEGTKKTMMLLSHGICFIECVLFADTYLTWM